MKKSVRIMSAVFVLLLLLSAVSCANTGSADTEAVTEAAATTALPEETTKSEIELNDPHVEALDWQGGDFFILYNGNDNEPNMDFVATELNGALLNDAVYKRNLAIEEKHRLTIKFEYFTDKEILNKVKMGVDSGDDNYQLTEANQNYTMTMAINGYIVSFDQLENIDLTKPYWNSSLLTESTINKKNYFAYSDANVHAFGATPCTIFNKTVLKNFNLGDLYKIVEDGEWTFAKMSEMVKTVTYDSNGDGQITHEDTLGMIANTFCIDCFVSGSGYKMVTKDADDFPVLNIDNEGFYNLVDSIKSLCDLNNGMYLVDRISTTEEAREYWPINALKEDRALFLIGNLKDVEKMRTSDADFGVVPIPKATAEQESYKIHLQANIGAAMSVPKTVKKLDEVSAILEDIAYRSYVEVMPIYMEVLIQGVSIRDAESLECIKQIRQSYYSDMGFMLGNYSVDILTAVRGIVKDNSGTTSTIKTKAKAFANPIKNIKKAFAG